MAIGTTPGGMTPENEQFIAAAISSGLFSSREEAVNEAVQKLREESQPIQHDSSTVSQSAEEWNKEFMAWAESHRHLPNEADDSRESIYAGRGE